MSEEHTVACRWCGYELTDESLTLATVLMEMHEEYCDKQPAKDGK